MILHTFYNLYFDWVKCIKFVYSEFIGVLGKCMYICLVACFFFVNYAE